MAAGLADEVIDGAHVWALDPADRPRITAFMQGLNRTRAAKFDHPGLDKAATRDGVRLLIQNDIGTNDAHVLVVQFEGLGMMLTYFDLHTARFTFFQALLTGIGATWSGVGARNTPGLNDGSDYTLGTAQFDCVDGAALLVALEGLGARIVFLIDWNLARKRLKRLRESWQAVPRNGNARRIIRSCCCAPKPAAMPAACHSCGSSRWPMMLPMRWKRRLSCCL